MTKAQDFEIVVIPIGTTDLGVDLLQLPNGEGGEPRRVVRAWGPSLQAVSDHLLEAMKEAGYRPSDLRRNRHGPFMVPERAGVRLALVLLGTKPLRKVRRIEDISFAVRNMGDDEAYYWFAKCTDQDNGLRAQKAFRDLWSGA